MLGAMAELVPALRGGAARAVALVALYVALAAINIRGVRTSTRFIEGASRAEQQAEAGKGNEAAR